METQCEFRVKRQCEFTDENGKKIKKVRRVVIGSNLVSLAVEEMKELLQCLKIYSPERVIEPRTISQLVVFLALNRDSDLEAVKLTVQVLSKLAEDGSGHAPTVVQKTKMVVQQGLVPLLVDILKNSGNQAIRKEAMWGLGIVASNSVECRDLVLGSGAMEAVVNYLLLVEDLFSLRKGSWVLANLCRGEPQLRHELWKLALGAVKHLLHHQLKDPETTRNACRALSYLSNRGNQEQIQAVVDTGACPRLLELMTNSFFAIPALRTIANIATVQVQSVLDHGGLDAIKKMMRSQVLHMSIVKEAGHAVSTIYAHGNKDRFHAILNPWLVKKEAA